MHAYSRDNEGLVLVNDTGTAEDNAELACSKSLGVVISQRGYWSQRILMTHRGPIKKIGDFMSNQTYSMADHVTCYTSAMVNSCSR